MVFNDMIERRRDVEVALTTATEFRERVMESSTNAIYTMDTEGRFTTANARTCEITGYPLKELIGMPWANMIPPEHLPALFTRYANTIESRTSILNYEVPLIQKGGSVVTITFSIAALSRDGQVFGVVGTAEDISERKRGQAELQSRADELARSNQELEQFAYVASHDLQEPLRTVSGFAQLLSKRYQGQLGPEADEYVGYVTTGVQRMKSLIEDLLAYSRVGRDPEALKPIDLNHAVSGALSNLKGAIDAAAATVVCEPLPTLCANERQMVQLFQNLIGNAVKFRGETPPVIHISAERRHQEWQITVRDNGIGISEKHAQQVFVLFQRLNGRDKYQGNGIGLTICKKIVDLHGGRIWVMPGDGGAVFRFTLRDESVLVPAAA
jgi:PAS domain S-box-containing protein